MKYIGPDFCNITSSLTDEELLIQKTANEFVSQEFLPIVNEYYDGNCRNDYVQGYKKEALSKKKESNLLGGTIGVLTILLLVSSSY